MSCYTLYCWIECRLKRPPIRFCDWTCYCQHECSKEHLNTCFSNQLLMWFYADIYGCLFDYPNELPHSPTNCNSSIPMNTDSSESRCKVTTLFPKNNGFQILWQHVADSCSGCLGCICSKGAILAVILHPKGKAMDSASISFREEQGLIFRKGLDFPNSFHSGWGQLLTKANFNPP